MGVSHTGYITVGDPYIQLLNRAGHIIWSAENHNVRIDNLTTYVGKGINLLLVANTGFMDIRGVDIRFKPGSTLLATIAADGVHLQGNRAQPVIEECYMEGMLDDGINNYVIPGTITSVAQGGTQFVVSQGNLVKIKAGDKLQFYNQFTGKMRGEVTVSTVSESPTNTFTITTATAIADVTVGEWVFNTTAAGPAAMIRINTFGRHRGRSVLTRTEGSKVQYNSFNAITWQAIKLDTHALI